MRLRQCDTVTGQAWQRKGVPGEGGVTEALGCGVAITRVVRRCHGGCAPAAGAATRRTGRAGACRGGRRSGGRGCRSAGRGYRRRPPTPATGRSSPRRGTRRTPRTLLHGMAGWREGRAQPGPGSWRLHDRVHGDACSRTGGQPRSLYQGCVGSGGG